MAQKMVYQAGLQKWHRNISLDEDARVATFIVALSDVQVLVGMNDAIMWLLDECKGFTVSQGIF